MTGQHERIAWWVGAAATVAAGLGFVCRPPGTAAGQAEPRPERAVIDEGFSHGWDGWWAEGGEKVWVEDGRLHVRADNPQVPGGSVATAWCRTEHPGDFVLELDAHVISSSIAANNINLFVCYADPSGKPLYDTRDSRSSAEYKLYHALDGYIITFLNDAAAEGGKEPDGSTKARVRIRRNPGFHLMAETFAGHCRQGVTYHLQVAKHAGGIRFAVDGREELKAVDPKPLGAGLLGLRTYRTYLWWDNVRLRTR